MEFKTIEVPTSRLEEVKAQLNKLIRRATRCKSGSIVYSTGEPILKKKTRTILTLDGPVEKDISVSVTPVTFFGEAPKLQGWDFIGRVEFLTGSSTPLLHTLDGKAIPETYRNNDGHCDHCQHDRRRNNVYILQHEDGRYTQVGRSCLRDFLGTDIPEQVVARFSFLKLVKEASDDEWGGRSKPYYSLKEVLELTSYAIRNWGWASSRVEFPQISTRESVSNLLIPDGDLRKQERQQIKEQYEINRQEAEATINWVKTELKAEGNYAINLKTIFELEAFDNYRLLGLVCSAVYAYQKAKADSVKMAKDLQSEYVGEVGTRLKNVEGIVKDHLSLGYGQFGETFLIKFLLNGKDLAVWFTGTRLDAAIGDVVLLDGTVKKHDGYKGIRQTILTRVKVRSAVLAAV